MDNFKGPLELDEAVSFANWDVFWYTRGFPSMDTDRARRHSSKVLTFPITVASVLHQNSGLTLSNQRVTPEGIRSLAGLSSLSISNHLLRELQQRCDPLYMFLQVLQILKKLVSENQLSVFLFSVLARKAHCRLTYGSNSACFSLQFRCTFISSVHRCHYQS